MNAAGFSSHFGSGLSMIGAKRLECAQLAGAFGLWKSQKREQARRTPNASRSCNVTSDAARRRIIASASTLWNAS